MIFKRKTIKKDDIRKRLTQERDIVFLSLYEIRKLVDIMEDFLIQNRIRVR
jgi:hypothetical protein